MCSWLVYLTGEWRWGSAFAAVHGGSGMTCRWNSCRPCSPEQCPPAGGHSDWTLTLRCRYAGTQRGTTSVIWRCGSGPASDTHHSGDTWKHIYLGPRNRSALRYWCYTNTLTYLLTNLPSVPWHCWLGVRKSTRPVKIQRWGADVVRVRCRMFAYGPDCYWGLFNYQKTAKYAKRRAKDVTGVTSFARQKTSAAH